jgi:hypothetical protein
MESTSIERAKNLLKETKLLQIVKSANMLTDLFGFDAAFQRIKPKREGKQIEMYLRALEGSLTFTLASNKANFKCNIGQPINPVAKIIINVKEDKILKTVSKIIVLKDSLFGLMKLAPLLITRKIKVKGSLIAALLLCRCLMIGGHEIYKGQL